MISAIYKSTLPNLEFGNFQGISILIYNEIFFKSQKINKRNPC